MKGNGMRTWFRGAKTLASGFFRKHGQMGAQAPVSTFLISVGLVAVIFFAIISWMWWWFPYHLFSDEVYDIVAVNAPQSFIDYNQYMQTSRDLTSKEYGSRTDLISNFDNIIRFNYTYDGYGATRFIYKENHALYDFVTFGKWMRENNAYLTVVFPEDFDGKVNARVKDHNLEKPDILTYYRTNSLEYTSMKEDFIDIYLQGYQDYLREKNGWAYANVNDSEIRDDPMDYTGKFSGRNFMLDSLGRSFVPLLMFIVILYAAMSAGTNVIAGQKELGTFTGYSAICMGSALPEGGHLDTLELNDELEDLILEGFERAGLDEKIQLHIGDCKETLNRFRSEMGLSEGPEADPAKMYDIVYMDANKREYCEYYDLVFDMVRPGGLILADNVLWDGKVCMDPLPQDKQTLGIVRFNDIEF